MPVTRNQSNAAVQAKSSSSDASEAVAMKDNSDKGGTSTEVEPQQRDSPDNCSICLGPFNNKSFTSSCAHSFCFVCLKQWSKVKPECPLCKQPFTSIFHNIRSNQSYDIYELPPRNPTRQFDYNFYGLTAFAPAHHYFSLPQPGLSADLTLSNFSRFQFRHRRYDRYLNPQHLVHGEHQYSFTSSSVNPSTHVSAATWPRGAEDFRLEVYRRYLGPPAVIIGVENSTYRLTPAMVAASSHRLHRIMPWLTRELRVLLRSHQSVRLAISVIQPLLTQVTIDSLYFSERVSPLIGGRSRRFIQEFVAFANSALHMQAFDRKAMYRRPDNAVSFAESTASSSSSDDNEVVEVTDISPEVQTGSATVTASTSGLNSMNNGWDSPTPGPSWDVIETASANPPPETDRVSVSSENDDAVFRPDLNESDSNNSKAGSDIVFLKYDKPWTERSPIQLSSDSDGEGHSKKKKKSKHKKKQKAKELWDEAILSGKSKTKSKNKDKSHSKSRTSSVHAAQSSMESGSSKKRKRSRSPSLSGKHKSKSRKKSKDKSSDRSGDDRDRKLVDRLFAEAISQKHANTLDASESDDFSSGKSKSKGKSRRSSGKDRSRRRKKHKNSTAGSASPSTLQSYKKHPSGHKKSTDPNGRTQGPPTKSRSQAHGNSSQEGESSLHSSRAESLEREPELTANHPLPPSNLNDPMTNTFQGSYMPMPDTVRRIPLNLWVSTWPSLPVPHTFPPAPTSTNFATVSVPQTAGLSNLPVLGLNQSLNEINNPLLDTQTISSESSDDSDSDESQKNSFNPHPNRSRTKQWLEVNFPDLGRQTSATSTTEVVSSSRANVSTIDSANLPRVKPSQGNVDHLCDTTTDVVSIGSDDEDIVVCSSDSSCNSDTDEVKVIEDDNDVTIDPVSTEIVDTVSSFTPITEETTSKLSNNDLCIDETQTNKDNLSHPSSSNVNVVASPKMSSSFQPFKLQRKGGPSMQNIDPFFSAASLSSDTFRGKQMSSGETEDNGLKTSGEHYSQNVGISESNGNESDTKDEETRHHDLTMYQGTPGTSENIHHLPISSTSPAVGLTVDVQSVSPGVHTLVSTTSAPFPSTNSSRESFFNPILPLASTSSPVAPVLPSTLSYLPYSSFSVSSSLSSILSGPLPFNVTETQVSQSVPLPFPFPRIPPLIPTPSNLYPSLYPSYSQPSEEATPVSAFLTNRDSSLSSVSSTSNSNLVVDTEQETHKAVTGDVDHNFVENNMSIDVQEKQSLSNSKPATTADQGAEPNCASILDENEKVLGCGGSEKPDIASSIRDVEGNVDVYDSVNVEVEDNVNDTVFQAVYESLLQVPVSEELSNGGGGPSCDMRNDQTQTPAGNVEHSENIASESIQEKSTSSGSNSEVDREGENK